MASASSYIPIRDDAGLKSLSTTERDFTRACALHSPRSLRTDGRNWNQLRHQRLQLIRWENGSSCTLQWGTSTRVTATVSAELIPPVPDRPSEGMLTFSVDLSPAASTSYRQAMPATTGMGPSSSGNRGLPPDEDQKLTSNRILRCLERILITGGALDTEALCVTPEQWVWKLSVAVTVLDAGGNLLDASALEYRRRRTIDTRTHTLPRQGTHTVTLASHTTVYILCPHSGRRRHAQYQ
jgi:exosome complex component RRP45